MNHTSSIFTVLSILVSTLVFAIWSNTHVYAQQLSSPPHAISSSSSSSSSLSTTTTISLELKAKMCDPSNPSLKVVNTTESHICGIPKTVKPSPSILSATPPTSAVSSTSTQQTTTKPTAITSVAVPKQQQVTTNSRSTGATTGAATIAPVSNPSSRLLSSS